MVLHGMSLKVTCVDFEHIMGVKDGGTNIELNVQFEDKELQSLNAIHCRDDGRIRFANTEKCICTMSTVDDSFCVDFVLLALAIKLYHTSCTKLCSKYLMSFVNPSAIKMNNWATFCFDEMLNDVNELKHRK